MYERSAHSFSPVSPIFKAPGHTYFSMLPELVPVLNTEHFPRKELLLVETVQSGVDIALFMIARPGYHG
jgi:hypothetical protein